MKLLHTSDWHLGMTARGGVSYLEDQRFMLKEICRIAGEQEAEGILLAGDVFDKSIASKEALELYDEIMTYLCGELGLPVFMIAGNHDGAERISQCRKLLAQSGLFIAGTLEKEPQVVHAEDADIWLLPWISTDKVRTLFSEEAEGILSMEDAYRIVLDHYRARFREGRRNILIAHAFVAGGETSESDRAAEVGNATLVGAGVFQGFDYVALGHLHGPQTITPAIRYSGTPMAYSFGKEEKQEKSVVIIDTKTMDIKRVPLRQLHKRMTLTGPLEQLLKADYRSEVLDAYLRLEVTDSYVGLEAASAFRERYRNLLEISGRGFEKEDSRITMTIEEFETAKLDPAAVFARYCEDILEEAPEEHLQGLFQAALARYEREAALK